MTIHDKIRDEKLQYDINILTEKQIKTLASSNQINKNILQVKKYYPLIKDKL